MFTFGLGTHKLIKKDFQREAFNVEDVTDDIYIIDRKHSTYKKLDLETYQNIMNGNLRF